MKRLCLACWLSWASACGIFSSSAAAQYGVDLLVALPADAQEVLQGHATQSAEIQARAAAEQRRLTERTLEQLQAVQDNYTRAAKLDEALAVRSEIRRIQAGMSTAAASSITTRASFPSYGELRQLAGQTFTCPLTGNNTGTIWGSDIYTDDSDPGTAAVHAGVLLPGEQGQVLVTVLGPQSSFPSTTRHGVTSYSWGSWEGAFRLARANAAGTVHPAVTIHADPGTVSALDARDGQVYYIRLTGTTTGSVYGNNVYTADSTLAAAAVHCGVLAHGQTGVVKVTLLGAQDSFDGTTRNGVRSSSWSAYYQSYRVEPTSISASSSKSFLEDPGYLYTYNDKVGQSFLFQVTGSAAGSVWGTDVYTSDSTLATAAVHAGVLANGQTGIVKVTMLPGQASYSGSTRNGITTSSWEHFAASYRVEVCPQ